MAAQDGETVQYVEVSGEKPVPGVAFNVKNNGEASIWSHVGLRHDVAYREPADYDDAGGGKTYHLYD